MESMYDYGSRAGFWRLQRLFVRNKIPCTVFAVGMALERNPAVCDCLKQMMSSAACGWEVASHGYRWIDYQNVDEATEREHIQRTVAIHERVLGRRPVGMYQGKVRRKSEGVSPIRHYTPDLITYPFATVDSRTSTLESWWRRRAASSTIRIPIPTICRTGHSTTPISRTSSSHIR
jgi:peptidoglycan/xylan/chitin deacetylase (PgdA/CDA1 family)